MAFRDNKEEEPFIPPTENANRIARREKCACGDTIELPADASAEMIERAVKRHQRSLGHRTWWQHFERTGQDW